MKKNLLLIIVILGLMGCDNFLEPKSDTLYIPKDIVSLDEMLLGVGYPRPLGTYTVMSAGLNLLDDDITYTSQTGTISSYDEPKATAIRHLYSWHPDMFEELNKVYSFYKGIWESHYRFILGVNGTLDYVDKVDGTYNEKTLVQAQAYALRGFYFFNLVNIFGEPYNYNPKALGIPLKLNSGVEQEDIARNTVEEVYEQVLKDLGEAEKLYLTLPKDLQYKKDLRVSLPMVQLLKSRVYLYMENWKEAANYAKKVIDDWKFSLMDLNTLEIPAALSYYPFINENASDVIWLFGKTSDVDAYLGVQLGYRYSIFNASKELVDGFKEGDLRKKHYIFREQNYPDILLPFGKNTTSFEHSLVSSSFSQAFRLPEAYLNLAEAAALGGDEATALKVLNDLREKRFTPEAPDKEVSGLTGKDLVEKIRQERRLELCFEFHRWFDLRRYGMPSIKHVWNGGEEPVEFVLQEKDPGYTLPIPKVVLNQNRALVQNKLANPR